jgi:hypothetical protein
VPDVGKVAWITVAMNCIGFGIPAVTCGKIEIETGADAVGRKTQPKPGRSPNEAVGRFAGVDGVLVGVCVGVGVGVRVVGVLVGVVGAGVGVGVGVGIVGVGEVTGGLVGGYTIAMEARARPSSGSIKIDALLFDRRPVAGRRLCPECGCIVFIPVMRM